PRSAGGASGEHGVRGEEGGEHHDVAEQEYPEAVADEYSLGRGTAAPMALRVIARLRHSLVAQPVGIRGLRRKWHRTHGKASPRCSARSRASRFVRSSRATISADISYS